MARTFRARDLMQQVARAAWRCADPGVQFDSTINRWHTSKASGRINGSNPCVTGDTLVATSEGWRRIDSLVGKTAKVIGADGQPHQVTNIFPTGGKAVYRLRTRSGFEVKITGDHKVWTENRGDIPVRELDDQRPRRPPRRRLRPPEAFRHARAHRDRPRRPFPDDRPPLGAPRG